MSKGRVPYKRDNAFEDPSHLERHSLLTPDLENFVPFKRLKSEDTLEMDHSEMDKHKSDSSATFHSVKLEKRSLMGTKAFSGFRTKHELNSSGETDYSDRSSAEIFSETVSSQESLDGLDLKSSNKVETGSDIDIGFDKDTYEYKDPGQVTDQALENKTDTDEVDGRFLKGCRMDSFHSFGASSSVGKEAAVAMMRNTERVPREKRKSKSKSGFGMFQCFMVTPSTDEPDSINETSPVFMQDPDAEKPEDRKVALGMMITTIQDGSYKRHFIDELIQDGLAYQFKFRVGDEILLIDSSATVNVSHENVVKLFAELKVNEKITFIFRRRAPLEKGLSSTSTYDFEDDMNRTSSIKPMPINELEFEYIKAKVMVKVCCEDKEHNFIVPSFAPQYMQYVGKSTLSFRSEDLRVIRSYPDDHNYLVYNGQSMRMVDGLNTNDTKFHFYCLKYIDLDRLTYYGKVEHYFSFCHEINGKAHFIVFQNDTFHLQEKSLKSLNSTTSPSHQPTQETDDMFFMVHNWQNFDGDSRQSIMCNMETPKEGCFVNATGETLDTNKIVSTKELRRRNDLKMVLEKI